MMDQNRTEPVEEWSLSPVLRRRADLHPELPWLSATSGESQSLAETDRRASAIAAGLIEEGVLPGDRVLVMAGNSLDFVPILFGIARAAATIVPVNIALSGQLLAHVLRDSTASLLIADEASLDVLRPLLPQLAAIRCIVVIGSPPGEVCGRRTTILNEIERVGVALPPEPDHRAVAAILYTSGTTGPAKGVLLPNAHLYLNALLFQQQMNVTAEDTIYCSLPLFHLNGLTLQLYCALITGCRLVLTPRFTATRWIDEIRACGATLTNLLGSMTEFILAQPERPEERDNKLRHVVAVPTLKSVRERFQARFSVTPTELYGMTEITCPIYMPAREVRPGSCGRLLEDWFEARIVDPETDRECALGAVGELVVRPRQPFGFMAGYHNRTSETLKAWRNLWFHTGDAMRLDPEGYFYFVDRLKDCVRRRGENISTFEVEQVLLGHDGVAEVAVVGVASAVHAGEQEVKAFVVPNGPFEPATLMAFCEANLPRFAVPRIFEAVASLPRTSTGKIEKRLLREAGLTPNCWIAADLDGPQPRPAR